MHVNKQILAILTLIILFAGIGCANKNINPKAKKMLFIAHRGESHDAPENTLKAFRLAWKRNTDGIELDVHMTADEKVVCIHDSHTGRTGNKKLVVADETYERLRQVDVGDGERIPLLSEVLAEAPAGRLIYIEIKNSPKILPALQTLIKNSPARLEDLRIISFENNILKEAKKIFPEIEMYTVKELSWNAEKNCFEPGAKKLLALQKEMRVDGFDLEACSSINKNFLAALQKNKAKIIVWTVDDLDAAKKFKALGIDAITSNRAAYLKKNLEN